MRDRTSTLALVSVPVRNNVKPSFTVMTVIITVEYFPIMQQSPVRSFNFKQESLALASMARDDPPASSTAAAVRGKVGSEFET